MEVLGFIHNHVLVGLDGLLVQVARGGCGDLQVGSLIPADELLGDGFDRFPDLGPIFPIEAAPASGSSRLEVLVAGLKVLSEDDLFPLLFEEDW